MHTHTEGGSRGGGGMVETARYYKDPRQDFNFGYSFKRDDTRWAEDGGRVPGQGAHFLLES